MNKTTYLSNKKYLNEDCLNIKKKIKLNFLKKKKIIISGSSGGLGLYLINFLLFLNEKFNYKIKIVAITRNPLIFENKIFYIRDNLKILKININKEKIKTSLKSDYFFHLSSPVNPKDYSKYPQKIILDIINSTSTVIDYLKKNNKTKLIYSSTSEIYVKKIFNINNVNNFKASDSYALGKIISEFMIINEIKNKQKIIILRLFNFFSPLESLKNSRIIPNMIYQSIKNRKLKIHSSGKVFRYFSYVKDVVISMIILLNKDVQKNIIDVGNPKNKISIKELGKEILKLNDLSEEKLIIKNLFNDTKGVKPNIKILKSKGFKPELDLKKELKRLFFFQKKNFK